MTKLPQQNIGGPIQENFDALAKVLNALSALVQLLLGGLAIRIGSSSVTFTASADSAQVTVAHGLGKTPTGVFLTAKQPTNVRVSMQESAAPDATNIFVKGFQTQNSVVTATQNFYWLVVG